jgi:Ca2+-binding RTX toxin-like protein
MSGHPVGRATAILVSSLLLASLAQVVIAAPAAAATPTCAGRVATIVGTAQGEVIRGTPRADVIVAGGGGDTVFGRGGADIICGNRGSDKLVGSSGNDRLYGGPGNDRLDGGVGDDACLQGSGTGSRVDCERPIARPIVRVLAIAYANLDRVSGFDREHDVLIAKLVDTDGNGADAGDRITMGYYPTVFYPEWPSDFGEWATKTHTVDYASVDPRDIQVHDADGVMFRWMSDYHGSEGYEEGGGGTDATAFVGDYVSCPITVGTDMIHVQSGSPSMPDQAVSRIYTAPVNRCRDNYFVDVEIR